MENSLLQNFFEFSSERRKKYKTTAEEAKLELAHVANNLGKLFIQVSDEKENVLGKKCVFEMNDYPDAFKKSYPKNNKLIESYEALNVWIRKISQLYCSIKVWLQFNGSSITGGGNFNTEVQTSVMDVINRVDSSANSLLTLSFDGVVKRSVLTYSLHLTPGNEDIKNSLKFTDKRSYTDLLSTIHNIRDDILQVLDLLQKNDEYLHYIDNDQGDEKVWLNKKESKKSVWSSSGGSSGGDLFKRKRKKIEEDRVETINNDNSNSNGNVNKIGNNEKKEKTERHKRNKDDEEESGRKGEKEDDGKDDDEIDIVDNKPKKKEKG